MRFALEDHLQLTADNQATILNQLGINHRRLIYPYQGLEERLTGVEPARVVSEILT